MVGMSEECAMENGGYGDLAGESVSQCLSAPSLRDQLSSIEKKFFLVVPN